jgi:hypothetical protein
MMNIASTYIGVAEPGQTPFYQVILQQLQLCKTSSVWDYGNTNHGFPVLEFTGTGINSRTDKFFKKPTILLHN